MICFKALINYKIALQFKSVAIIHAFDFDFNVIASNIEVTYLPDMYIRSKM
jgi:hypothetical protein